MRTAPRERAAALAILFGALAACGQRGPLTLPDSVRPIEALPSVPATPPTEPGSVPAPLGSTGTSPPTQAEPDSDDERSDRDEPELTRER
jgi:predicted small lipoprotein YifL